MSSYLAVLLRFLIIFPLLYLITSLMGKRSIGELPVIDFIVAITIGNVVGADLADPTVPHGPTVMIVIVLGLTQYGFTWLRRINARIRNLSTMTPTVVVEKGQFLTHNISGIRYTINDILPMLRAQGVFRLSEVQTAIIEPNGKLSVQKKASANPVTPEVMGIPVQEPSPTHLLIADGRMVPQGLAQSGKDQAWLERELKRQGYQGIEDVYLAAVEGENTLYTSPLRQQDREGQSIYY